MTKFMQYISMIFYFVLGILNILIGITLIYAYMTHEEYRMIFTIVGCVMLLVGGTCIYVSNSIGDIIKKNEKRHYYRTRIDV